MIIEEYLTLCPRDGCIQRTDTFTLTFARGVMALLQVYNAPTPQAASRVARAVLPGCPYTVTSGDQTDGRAAVFYAWGYQGQDAHDSVTGEEEPSL